LYNTDATSIMLDNLPADLGEPKGEEVGVADLLPGFPVAHCTRQMPPVSC
jgi:hypothetical protein